MEHLSVLRNHVLRQAGNTDVPNPLSVSLLNSFGTGGRTGSATYSFNSGSFGDSRVLAGDIIFMALLVTNGPTPITSHTMDINGDAFTVIPTVNGGGSENEPVIMAGYRVATTDYDDAVSPVVVTCNFGSGSQSTYNVLWIGARIRNSETSALYAYDSGVSTSTNDFLTANYVEKGYVLAFAIGTPSESEIPTITGTGAEILSTYYSGADIDSSAYSMIARVGYTTNTDNLSLTVNHNILAFTPVLSSLVVCFH